ncbi:unnamed protein product, partial [Meganyctiphanes norvegica]
EHQITTQQPKNTKTATTIIAGTESGVTSSKNESSAAGTNESNERIPLIMIISCSAAGLLILVIVVITIGLYLRCRRKKAEDQQSELQLGDTNNRHNSENSLYAAYTNEENAANVNRGGRHNSENSLYGTYPNETNDTAEHMGRRHDSDNSLYASAWQ